MNVALVTCARLSGLDPDDLPLQQALEARGASVAIPVWNDPSVDWSRFDLVVTRSTWDYHLDRAGFLAWLQGVERVSRPLHPSAVVAWNSHKGYLGDLEARGLPVTPTVYLPAEGARDVRPAFARLGHELVVKPTVGLDSFGVGRFSDPVAAQQHVDGPLAGREVMLQPYLASVADHGERCLVVLGDTISHAIRKNSFFLGGRHAGPEGRTVDVADDERETARRVLEGAREVLASRGVTAPLRYARVDLARDASGRPLLMELELVEPTLFFTTAPGAAERFSDVLLSA